MLRLHVHQNELNTALANFVCRRHAAVCDGDVVKLIPLGYAYLNLISARVFYAVGDAFSARRYSQLFYGSVLRKISLGTHSPLSVDLFQLAIDFRLSEVATVFFFCPLIGSASCSAKMHGCKTVYSTMPPFAQWISMDFACVFVSLISFIRASADLIFSDNS